MGRPSKPNKLPMTSISVSQKLWEILREKKRTHQTMDEYLRHLVSDYYVIKDEFSFVEEAYNKASKKVEEYVQREAAYLQEIAELRKINYELRLGNIEMIEPARGVAATPKGDQSITNKIEMEVIE
ncbi:MAG: hypothetical protein ABJB85_09165 [Nitrososphaerota archaeon]